jgi:hypothetical protein
MSTGIHILVFISRSVTLFPPRQVLIITRPSQFISQTLHNLRKRLLSRQLDHIMRHSLGHAQALSQNDLIVVHPALFEPDKGGWKDENVYSILADSTLQNLDEDGGCGRHEGASLIGVNEKGRPRGVREGWVVNLAAVPG